MDQIPHKDPLLAELIQVAQLQRARVLQCLGLIGIRELTFFVPFHFKVEFDMSRSWPLLASIALLLRRPLVFSTD